VLPASNQRAEELRAEIRGRKSPRTWYRPERRWVFGEEGRLYSYRRASRNGRTLEGFTLLKIDRSEFRLAERWHAERAVWDGSGWNLERGWARFFPAGGEERFEAFEQRRQEFGEDPTFLEQEWHAPEQMNFVELRRYVKDLRSGGYDVRELSVTLHERLVRPWISLVMVLVALPFALRVGRQSPMTALGISLALGLAFVATREAGSKFGEVGMLSAAAAVWGPSLLFAGAGAWTLARVRG
jgi:lipopolysaccharide export LptBFGC system permease protein LptF